MTTRTEPPLQLACPGCGTVVGLSGTAPLVATLRPFLREHRACGAGAAPADREMRTAYAHSA